MSKVMLGDYYINTDDIVSISDDNLVFYIPLPSKTEKIFIFTVTKPTEYEHKEFSVVKIRFNGSPELLVIYNDSALTDCIAEYLENLNRVNPHDTYNDYHRQMVETIEKLGPEMVFGRRWINLNYLNNMVYIPDIKSKRDFLEKYL